MFFPKTRPLPSVGSSTVDPVNLTVQGDSLENILKIYTSKLYELFENDLNESITESSKSFNSVTYSTSNGSFSLWCSNNIIGIDIDGADTGYWHNDEYESIDVLFWYAVGVLRSGIRYRKPLIGLEQAWIFSNENKSWAIVPKKYHFYGYTKFTKKSPKL